MRFLPPGRGLGRWRVPSAGAYVGGSLGDGEQRRLLAAKLDQIEDKRRQLGQMAQFLRAKLEDLGP